MPAATLTADDIADLRRLAARVRRRLERAYPPGSAVTFRPFPRSVPADGVVLRVAFCDRTAVPVLYVQDRGIPGRMHSGMVWEVPPDRVVTVSGGVK